MISPVHTYEVLIVERHLDTFGHVNNATYLDLFEAARWDWITQNGFGLDRIRETQKGPTLLEIKLNFLREVRNRQKMVIASWVDSYTRKVGTVLQEMRDESGEVYCEGRFLCALFDLKERKLLSPTPEWLAAVGVSPDQVR